MYYETKTLNENTGNYVNRIWVAKWDYETTIREIMPNTNIYPLAELVSLNEELTTTKQLAHRKK